ncbi:MAG: hypothetical protein HY868_16665 [Chloroflexi bacterium]|nr:hypothetical protein [Chloroflexota bacterium]
MKLVFFLGLTLVVGIVLGYELAADEWQKLFLASNKRNAMLLGMYVRKAMA